MRRTPVEKKTAPLKLKIEYPSEAWEQMELIDKCIKKEHEFPALARIYHNANGEERPARTYTRRDGTQGRYCPSGVKLKRMGEKPGIPDLHLPVARGKFHSLYIEMKSTDPKAQVSEDQQKWIDALRDEGHAVAVCRGWVAAWKILMWYLTLEPTAYCPCFNDPLRREERLDAA